MSEISKPVRAHAIVCENRETARISGVSEVLSFDEHIVLCQTDLGALLIKGVNLKVNNLNADTGDLGVDGFIDSFAYENAGAKSKQSVFGKIFK